jgi:hypothetical protein
VRSRAGNWRERDGASARPSPDGTEKAIDDVHRAVFGDPVDGIVAGSKCDDKIAKRAGKKFDTELKAFRALREKRSAAGQPGCRPMRASRPASTTRRHRARCSRSSMPTLRPSARRRRPREPTMVTAAPARARLLARPASADIVDCQACLAMNNSANGTPIATHSTTAWPTLLHGRAGRRLSDRGRQVHRHAGQPAAR